jgi:hypothetical protein
VSVAAAADRLAAVLEATPARLGAISDEDAARPSGPGRWAPKEVLGHLIDSAGNNHQRFVRAQIVASLADPGYDQETWVATQRYAAEPWHELIQLWTATNRHLLHLMRNVRETALETPISIRGGPPMTLSHVMIDYVRHLEHHLSQILPKSS